MSKSTIAHVLAGKVPPLAHIELIRKVFPKQFGFATQYEGRLVVHNDENTWKMSNDDIVQLLNGTKDDGHRLLFFANYDKCSPGDIMPWSLLNSESAPMLALTYEGNFSKYAALDAEHTAEFNALSEVLGAKISTVLDDNTEKTIVALKSDKFINAIKLQYDGRGWFTFLPIKGAPFSFGDNTLMKGWDWGTLSNSEGVDIPVEKKEEPAPAKPASGNPLDFLSSKKVTSEAPPIPAQSPGPVADPIPSAVPGGPGDKSPPGVIEGTDTKIVWVRTRVPAKLDASAKNFWIRLFNKDICKAFTDGDGTLEGVDHLKAECYVPVHPSLLVFANRDVKTNRDVRQLYEDIRKEREGGKIKDFPAAANTRKTGDLSRSTVREGLYAMTEKDMEECMTIMAEYLGDGSRKRPSPDELKAVDSKKATFSENIGVNFAELMFTPDEIYFKMFGGNKKAVACVRELISELTKHLDLGALAGTLIEVKTPSQQVEVPSPQPVAAPAKSSNPLDFLSNKKVA